MAQWHAQDVKKNLGLALTRLDQGPAAQVFCLQKEKQERDYLGRPYQPGRFLQSIPLDFSSAQSSCIRYVKQCSPA